MAFEDMILMVMDATSLSYLSSSTSNESSSSLTSTSDDYFLSSTDSVKPTVTKNNFNKDQIEIVALCKKKLPCALTQNPSG